MKNLLKTLKDERDSIVLPHNIAGLLLGPQWFRLLANINRAVSLLAKLHELFIIKNNNNIQSYNTILPRVNIYLP